MRFNLLKDNLKDYHPQIVSEFRKVEPLSNLEAFVLQSRMRQLIRDNQLVINETSIGIFFSNVEWLDELNRNQEDLIQFYLTNINKMEVEGGLKIDQKNLERRCCGDVPTRMGVFRYRDSIVDYTGEYEVDDRETEVSFFLPKKGWV